jgi:hypothetical protein
LTLLKSIVVCLVLVNVGYFLWARGIAKTPEAPAQVAPATTTLKLASELPEAARRSATDASGAAVGGSTVTGGSDSTDAPRAEAGAGGGIGGGTSGGMSGGANGGMSGGANGGTSGTSGGTSGGVGGATLLTNVKRCISVGPFPDVSEAAHAATTLRGGGYDPRQRVADGDIWAGVWVYLPLPVSRPAADQILAKLKAGGIDDALEMPGPNEGSVISLGLYSESKRAQSRVVQAQALGFNPGIADRKRTGNVYWIDIDLKPTDSLLNPADLQGEAGRIVRLEVKGCPSVSRP